MASKDWKVLRKNYWFNVKKRSSIYVDNFPNNHSDVPSNIKNKKGKDVYIVEWAKSQSHNFKQKYFKTKTKAVAFAKAYMKKH